MGLAILRGFFNFVPRKVGLCLISVRLNRSLLHSSRSFFLFVPLPSQDSLSSIPFCLAPVRLCACALPPTSLPEFTPLCCLVQRAGSAVVHELHGTVCTMTCVACKKKRSVWREMERLRALNKKQVWCGTIYMCGPSLTTPQPWHTDKLSRAARLPLVVLRSPDGFGRVLRYTWPSALEPNRLLEGRLKAQLTLPYS